MRRSCLAGAVGVLLLSCGAAAQSPRFEVASVKPIDPSVPQEAGIKIHAGGTLAISGLSLKALVGAAYGVAYWQIGGGEPWMERETFRVDAKPPADLQPGIQNLRHTLFSIEDPRLREMLGGLLAERFGLKIHRETKTGDVYTLERNGKALKLRPAENGGSGAFGSIGYVGGSWGMTDTTMAQLAKFASDYIFHVPVKDGTGLSGAFDYRQQTADLEPNYSDNSVSFRRLLPELGLTLERGKGPVERLIIDKAVRPAAN